MDLQGQAGRVLDLGYQLVGNVRSEHARHVLDADGIRAGALHLVHQGDKVANRMDLAGGIANCRLHLSAGLFGGTDRGDQVAGIVQGVEDTQNVDAVLDGLLHERLDDIVRIVMVAKQVLTAKKHLQLGVLDVGANGAQALPGILVQKAQARIERRAAPHL